MYPRRTARVIRSLLLIVVASAATEASPLRATSAASTAEQLNAANLDLVLKDLDSKDVRLSQFKGKVIVLNLWATWCGPCRKEIPDLLKLQAAYRGDVAVLGIVVQDKFGANVRAFAREFGIGYPILNGNDHQEFEKAFGPFWGLPTSVVVDREGRIRKKHQGQVTMQQLEREIRPLIGE